jgi:hypothetical protein
MSRPRGRWFLLVVLVLAGAAVVWKRVVGPTARQMGPPTAAVERLIPDTVRVKVEVLNATTVRGLARRATFHLRDLGFDVVSSGNSNERLDTTLVLVRSGRMDWGELAAQGLAPARVEVRPDTSRYLDLTILLGTSWRPPPEAFHP